MSRKLMCLAVIGLVFGLGGVAKAISIELSSPQEGTVVHPGDIVQYTLTVTNDSNAPDIARVALWITVGIDVNNMTIITDADGKIGTFRLLLRPRQVITHMMQMRIPENLPLLKPDIVHINADALGRLSGTRSIDRISFAIEPLKPQPAS